MSADTPNDANEPAVRGGFDYRNITDHATDRLRERASLDAQTAARAWHQGERIEHGLTRLVGDEVRYNPTLRIVLIRKGSAITTIIDADTANPDVQAELSRSTGWSL